MAVCLECQNITKRFEEREVLAGVDWTLPCSAVTGLLGDSGAGKTTLVRIIAGLERPTAGRILWPRLEGAGEGRRSVVGMVFQNLGLWPHLSARSHLEYVLSSLSRDERRRQAERLLAEMRIPPEAWDRRPAQLSGGESQRVALARALALDPDLLLLDEPLSQVDMALRAEMLELIRAVAASRQATVIYVSHSWPEVLELCGRIAVLSAGRIVQEGPTVEVLQGPADAHVARLTGAVVEVPAALLQEGLVGWDAEPAGLRGAAPWLVRPHQIRFAAPAGRNCWRVLQTQPHSSGWRVTLLSGNYRWSVVAHQRVEPETVVAVCIAPARWEQSRPQ